jgi:hypothetical protein
LSGNFDFNEISSDLDFCFLLLNVQGLASVKKILLLKDYLVIVNLKFKPLCLVLTETWLGARDVKSLQFLDYKQIACFGRLAHLRGGVAIMAQKNCVAESVDVLSREFCFESQQRR